MQSSWRATHRFFVQPDAWQRSGVSFSAEQARQMARVLRLAAGDLVVALDGSGSEWLVRLETASTASARGQIVDERPAAGEPTLSLTLYQALLPREKFELVLQKGTEIGISVFAPIITERTLARDLLPDSRLDRWRAILREAAEQSRRGRVPEIRQAARFDQALASAASPTLRLFAWEQSDRPLRLLLRQHLPPSPSPLPSHVALWIGPEGGFSQAEARRAEAAGLHLVSLGPRILRTETAGLVLASLVLYEAGELEPRP